MSIPRATDSLVSLACLVVPPRPILAGSGARGGGLLQGGRCIGARVCQAIASRRERAQDGLHRNSQRSDERLLQEVLSDFILDFTLVGVSTVQRDQ